MSTLQHKKEIITQPVMIRMDRINNLMNRVFDASKNYLDGLSDGDRVSMKVLTEKVSEFLDVPQSQVAPFVTMFVRSYDQLTVVKGRSGGIFKGVLPKKIDDTPRCDGCGRKMRPAKAKDAA